MSTDNNRLDDLLAEEFQELSIRNELRLAKFILLVSTIGLAVALWIWFTIDQALGMILAGLALFFGLYYGLIVPRILKTGKLGKWTQVVNVTIEATVPAAITLADVLTLGGVYALTSTPPFLSFVAVIGSGLRLRKSLCIYSGLMATSMYLVVYCLARSHITPDQLAQFPTLGWAFTINHAAYLLGCGLLASLVAHAGSSMTRRVALQVVAKERLGDLFGEYVSPNLLDKVDAGEITLGGEQRQVTILFADIRDFTPLAYDREPQEVVDYLNSYFSAVCQAITANHGMVNKFIGDGLLAVFGAPEADPDHALHAAQAALDMVEATRKLRRPDEQDTRIGVGLHTGDVIIGSIGSSQRKDYTVIGDTVNLASRLESLTKKLGQPILLSATTAAAAHNALVTEVCGAHKVKGRDEEVEVLSLSGLAKKK